MPLISGNRLLQSCLLRAVPSVRSVNTTWWNRGVATVPPHAHHPNPGNFANRSHDELAAIGQKGGKKGGKATSGGFHGTNTDKQDIVKRRRRKAAAEHEESELNELEAEQRGRSHEPSVVPPGFEEWKTCA